MMTDPISDMLTRLRNAGLAHLDRSEMPLSRLKERLAAILKQEGFIADYRVEKEHPGKRTIFLKYGRDREFAIAGLQRKSRPGRRHYVGYRDIPKVLNGLGINVLSTSSGIMTGREARQKGYGGEILCDVY